MKRVILFYPKTDHHANYKFHWIPYSILSIAAPLKELGYDVIMIDQNAHPDYKISNLDLSEVCAVGISSMIGHQISHAIEFCKKIRALSKIQQKQNNSLNMKIPIVWGGALPTLLPKLVLESGYADYIIRGPGDELFPKLIDAIVNQKKIPSEVGYNISINSKKSNKNIEINPGEITTLKNRNSLPSYPFELLNLEEYVRNDPQISSRVINYVSSIGCPFQCGFCSDVAMFKSKWQYYDANRILHDIKRIRKSILINGVKFYDSNFFANPSRAMAFAQRLIDEDIKIKWAASAHPKNILSLSDADLLILKNSGLCRILIGAESGVQSELDFIKKNIKLEEISIISKRLEKHGIIASFTFVTGYPTMPIKNIDATISFAKNLAKNSKIHEFKIHIYLPFPGTLLFDLAVHHGFNPPSDIVGWAELDYYSITTPWVPAKYSKKIREFNKQFCPYVE